MWTCRPLSTVSALIQSQVFCYAGELRPRDGYVPFCAVPATLSPAPLTLSEACSRVDFWLSGFKLEAALSVGSCRLRMVSTLAFRMLPIVFYECLTIYIAGYVQSVRHLDGMFVWVKWFSRFSFDLVIEVEEKVKVQSGQVVYTISTTHKHPTICHHDATSLCSHGRVRHCITR